MAYTIGNKGTISKLYRYLIRGDTQRRLVKLHRFFFHTYLEGSKQTVSKKNGYPIHCSFPLIVLSIFSDASLILKEARGTGLMTFKDKILRGLPRYRCSFSLHRKTLLHRAHLEHSSTLV